MDKLKEAVKAMMIDPDSKIKFAGTILMLLPFNECNEIDTIGIVLNPNGKISLGYNKEFVEKLNYKQIEYVMLHEAYHIAFNHLKRFNEFKGLPISKDIHNFCADAAVNSIIGKPPITGAVWPPDFKLPLNLSYEEYLKILLNKCKNGSNNNNNNGNNKSNNKGGSNDIVIKKGNDTESYEGQFDTHKYWGDVADSVEYENLKHQIKTVFERFRGSLPGNIAELIDIGFAPVRNWRLELRAKLAGEFKHRLYIPSTLRQSRRYPKLVNIVPGKEPLYTDKIAIFIDTSASMSDEEVSNAYAYALALPYPKIIYQIDAAIQGKPMKVRGKVIMSKIKRQGYGGTDFRPAFEEAKKIKAKIIMFFTDLEGKFPDYIPDAKVYWVKYGDAEITPPFGQVIEAKIVSIPHR